ncbi:MAG TPA: YraN family protein [Candidatus Saccharimonadales bacterium]|nr:YraN family protein [Candidatus Saccharimonadales bacterium]
MAVGPRRWLLTSSLARDARSSPVTGARRGTVYFCEVKYRKSDRQGGGFEYITPKKLQQMRFAAESWVHAHNWRGAYELCAIEVSGLQFRITGAVKGLG